jgi:hypothetical protein
MDWEESNCGRCRKASFGEGLPTCPLQLALMTACFGDGSVSDDIAERIGFTEHEGHYCWPCKELDDATRPQTIKPLLNQIEMFQ